MTIQMQMKATLEAVGLPHKQIECYGSQIVITSTSMDTANKWAAVVAKFATVRRVLESLDETAASAGQTRRSYTKVWRTYARI